MRPIDPRLMARVGPARRFILTTGALGVVGAVLVLAQALVIARALAPVLSPVPLDGDGPLAGDGLGAWGALVPIQVRDVSTGLTVLAVIVALRAAAVWLQERLAHRAGSRVISELREAAVAHAATLGPRWAASGEGVRVATLVTRGLDNLLPYFVRYLPALVTAATVTPLALVVVLGLDRVSAVIVLVTLPLIPIFMVLVGRLTQQHSARHLEAMQRLGARVLDLITGLPTLRGLGRSRGPAQRVRELGEAHRRATMGSLRVAFLSGMVLELLTTLSVALVAVSMGFRLADGGIGIETALAVLILAPEVYLPLRNVGTHFHASADGLAAADDALRVLATPAPDARTGPVAPPLAGRALRLTGLSVATPAGKRLAPHALSLTAKPGEVTALVGPNGDGKSTALMAAAGLLAPSAGTVRAGGAVLATADGGEGVDGASWSSQVAWVPQRPDLGPRGRQLSLGQRQRVALGRAFESGRPWVLLDEPTAHLDARAREGVISRMRAAAAAGAVVLVATHDPAVIAAADRTARVVAREVAL